ncbi:M20 family metallopeptidase [Desulfatirhabdium butyrativorans]|uniref:M20 family metallopeptidase n=1 Tax=Desulfatirhabdium butyrativorans TaxID=340467 RepID=UPI0004247B9B|nr:M20 family metallopeptidase [Desulfatirhabdium butyrativorans]
MRKSRFSPLLSVLLLLFVCAAGSASADQKKITAAIDEASKSCRGVSQQIWEFKETGQQEFKSSALLKEELTKLGYSVTGDLKVPEDLVKGGVAKTAFKAEMVGKGPGPTVTIMLEYDALANGHACGHNLIATSGLMAAAGLAKVMKDTPGRVWVIGTPDEERGSMGGGKVALLEGGYFDGSDVVFITHGSDRWSLDQRLLAMKRATFTFKGKSAHAAAAPHKGINALRGVLLTFNCVDSLREHLRQDVRIHGVIPKGGGPVNVVPDLAQAEFACRALDTITMENAYQKIVNCAKAGELGTGATLEFKEPRVALKAAISVPPLLEDVQAHLKALGVSNDQFKDFDELASSDLGMVSYTYPTVNVWFKIAPEGTALHSDAFREAANSDEGWKSTVVVAKAVALSAYDMLTKPEKRKAVQESFQAIKAKEGK